MAMPLMAGRANAASRRPADKVQQILQAAREEFLRHGYGAASMDAVALGAKVSKATLYVYFRSKRDLFAAIIKQERGRYGIDLMAVDVGRETIKAKLTRCGCDIVDFLVSPETVASYRMVVAEAGRFPELGQVFYDAGPERLLDHLEEFIAGAMDAGYLRRDQPRVAAEQFLGLVRGNLQLCALLGISERLSRERIDRVVSAGVDTFYRAFQPESVADVLPQGA